MTSMFKLCMCVHFRERYVYFVNTEQYKVQGGNKQWNETDGFMLQQNLLPIC